MRRFMKHAYDRDCLKRSLKIALVVGTLLGAINHYDSLAYGTMTSTELFQMGITYLVPFSVSLYGSAAQARHIECCKVLEKNQQK